jgi:hypothetical protein
MRKLVQLEDWLEAVSRSEAGRRPPSWAAVVAAADGLGEDGRAFVLDRTKRGVALRSKIR